ncbi:MAG TPA: hypothetical protein VI217_12410 [Mycobacterium sp.]
MANEQSKKGFAEEFKELKARHGAQYADLRLVRFRDKDGQVGFGTFVPYFCRENDDGDIVCEEERPV